MNFISKKAITRRTVLRGMGATLALPLLDAMIPAATALSETAAAPVRRLGYVFMPMGCDITRWTPAQIDELLQAVEQGVVHPMEAKKKLAWEIVSIFDGDEAADKAAAHFAQVHQQRRLPDEMPTYTLTGPTNVVEIIFDTGMARSKSEARRLVKQGAVKLDGGRVASIETEIKVEDERVLQVGKRRFLRLVPGDAAHNT